MGLFSDMSPDWKNALGLFGAAIQDYGSRIGGQPGNAFDANRQELAQQKAYEALLERMAQSHETMVPPAATAPPLNPWSQPPQSPQTGLLSDMSPNWKNALGLFGAAIKDYGARRGGQPATAFDAYQRELAQQNKDAIPQGLMNSLRLERSINEARARQRLQAIPAYDLLPLSSEQLWAGGGLGSLGPVL